jgi:hypothetical protein
MHILARRFVPTLVLLLMVSGCSHPTRTTAPSPSGMKAEGARLAETDVIRIAGEAAVKRGFRLADFKAPEVHPAVSRGGTWTLFYEGKTPRPGNHFLVWVTDQSGAAQVMPGE